MVLRYRDPSGRAQCSDTVSATVVMVKLKQKGVRRSFSGTLTRVPGYENRMPLCQKRRGSSITPRSAERCVGMAIPQSTGKPTWESCPPRAETTPLSRFSQCVICYLHGHASVAHGRSSRQGCGSYGVRVPSPSVSRFGRLAYSMHVSGNSTCSARTKTPRLPCRLRTAAVGAIGVASKLGGLNISEWLQLRKYARSGNRWSGLLRESRPDCHAGKADVIEGRNGNVHLDDPPR